MKHAPEIVLLFLSLVVSICVISITLYATVLDGMTAEQRAFQNRCLASDQADKNRDTEFCKKGWPK